MRAFLQAPRHLPNFSRTLAPVRKSAPRKPPIRAMSALWQADLGEVINLGKGHPNARFLPLEEFQAAVTKASQREDAARTMLNYGRIQGNPRLCKCIADWIAASAPGRPNTPGEEHILITTGAGPGLSAVSQLFSKPGEAVLVDSPGYFLSYYSFKDCGLEVVSVPTDAKGLDIDRLEKLLEEGIKPALVYTVPIANNPTGVGMSEERKERLVKLGREHGFKIIADEVYSFLTFNNGEVTPKSLFEYDDPSDPVVLSIGSFSKLLGPGMRLGWIAAHKPLLDRIMLNGALMSGGGYNPLTAAIVVEMMESGFVERQVKALREQYGSTCEVLCACIEEYLRPVLKPGEVLKYEKPEGGFFCFITLPERFDCEKLLELANKHGVSYFAGRHSSPDKKGFTNCLRLCFAMLEAETIREGMRRLGEAMKAY